MSEFSRNYRRNAITSPLLFHRKILISVKIKTFASVPELANVQCGRRDSNPHALRRQISRFTV